MLIDYNNYLIFFEVLKFSVVPISSSHTGSQIPLQESTIWRIMLDSTTPLVKGKFKSKRGYLNKLRFSCLN